MKNNQKTSEHQIEKSFGLTTLALKNKNSVYFLTFLIVIMGILTYQSLPKDSFPEIEQPIIYVGTPYPGNSPIDIENLITRHIEKEINTISGVDDINSTSIQDYSTIIVEFSADIKVQEALQKVKDAVDKARIDLPNDLPNDPDIFEINFSELPIFNINLSGNFTMDKLKSYAELFEDEIEKLSGVSKVEIRGLSEKEIRIMVDPFAMEARKVSFDDIANAVQSENMTLSGGNILEDGIRRTIRIVGEFTAPSQISEIVVKRENNNIVYLRDIATVDFDYVEAESFARLAGQPVVSVDVIKRSGSNILETTEKVNVIMDELKKQLPPHLKITITNDQSSNVKEMVSSLENNIISGVILVVLILLFFLGSRNALFVGVAIPLSMFIAFNILGIFGITVNMMILFSLILALGMLVDNGIVVVENVYRRMEEGLSPIEATKSGVGEVAMPIISSTATTLAAFLPLMLWPGLIGEFMAYLPIGVMITLTSSLFVALVVNPVLIATFMKVQKGKRSINFTKLWRNIIIITVIGVICLFIGWTVLGNLLLALSLIILLDVFILAPFSSRFQSSFLPWLELQYFNILTFALKGWRPFYFFLGTLGIIFFTVFLMTVKPPKVLFFPENEPAYANIFIEFPIGTDIEKTNQVAKKIEAETMLLIAPYRYMIESVVSKVGEDTADPNAGPSGGGKSPNKARITINFVKYKFRKQNDSDTITMTSSILDMLRNKIPKYAGVNITVDKDAAGPPVGKPISIEIFGNKMDVLIGIAEDMKKHLNQAGIKGIEHLQSDVGDRKPEVIIHIDREKARRFGLSTYSIANEIRTSLFGRELDKFKLDEDDYDVELRLQDEYRYNLDALINKSITFRNQSNGRLIQVPISAVATAEMSTSYNSVKRKNLDRVITISSNVLGGYNATDVNENIKEQLKNFEMPVGYEFKFGGEQEKQQEEFAFLQRALLLAIFLIFLIIVAQFNKITTPFIIMISVILSTVGAILGLLSFNMDFVIIMSMIGIISLAGIVVNNAIVLIDFIELIRKRKLKELGTDQLPFQEIINAIILGGKVRLRPVLLTAITTILGLAPLALGINFDFSGFFSHYDGDFYMGGDNVIFWGPMSWTIIFGLTFATFLTLIIVPILYLFFARVNRVFSVVKN